MVNSGDPRARYRAPAEGLLVWDAPGEVRRLVVELQTGAAVLLLQREGEWALVEYAPGATGWVESRHLTQAPPIAPAAQPAPPLIGSGAQPAARGLKPNIWWAAAAAALVVVLVVIVVVVTRPSGSSHVTGPVVATQVVSVTPSVRHGQKATLQATTTAGATCSITVTYTTGPSHASSLHTKVADDHGSVEWTWIVGARTKAGTFPIKVSCNPGGEATSQFTTT